MGRESAKYVPGDKLPCMSLGVFARKKRTLLGPKKKVYMDMQFEIRELLEIC